jgi:hypothetical protein
MPHYRFYSIKKNGHVAGPAIDLDCPDDGEALKEARQQVNGLDIEIWQGPRVVAYLTSDERRYIWFH